MRVTTGILCLIAVFFCVSCTFVYETGSEIDDSIPDITLENVEWTRVRKGSAQARLEAVIANRFEKTHIMELQNYTFEQYDTIKGTVDSSGLGGKARVELESGNMKMSEDVVINIKSEDMSLEAADLEWRDKEKTLTSPSSTPVHVEQDTGTDFRGSGFSADVRARTWLFASGVEGDYYLDETEE